MSWAIDIKLSKSVRGSQSLPRPSFCFLVAEGCTASSSTVHCLPAGPEAPEQEPSISRLISQVFVAVKES